MPRAEKRCSLRKRFAAGVGTLLFSEANPVERDTTQVNMLDLIDMQDILVYTSFVYQEDFMAAITKQKQHQTPNTSSAQLFGKLQQMFSMSGKAPTPQKVSIAISQALQQVQKRGNHLELIGLRQAARELASQVDKLVPSEDRTPPQTPASLRRALREDALFESMLHTASDRGPFAMSTPESIQQGNEAMTKAEQNTATITKKLIESKELLTSGELQSALHVQRQAISSAVKAKRLFAIVGPSGENYYPAYFADASLDRRTLEKISKVLGSLPAQSKHHFFTSKWTTLQDTPLDALRNGRETEVLIAAAGFAER